MLILKVISIEAMHGWGICERIQQISKDQLQVNQGSLYTSLHKLLREGWIKSFWTTTENNRRARYYALTRAGQRQLGAEAEHWDRLAEAVGRILDYGTLENLPNMSTAEGTSDLDIVTS